MCQNKHGRLKDEQLLRSFLSRFENAARDPDRDQEMFENIRVRAALQDRPELVDFIIHGLEFESIFDFAQAFGYQEQPMDDAEEVFSRMLTTVEICDLLDSCLGLLNGVWLEIAKRPQLFRERLRDVLRDIGVLARRIYGLPNHRMAVHESRDRDLWRLKKIHPNLTWGQLALKGQVSPGSARLAYKRHAERERRRLKCLHDHFFSWLPVKLGHSKESGSAQGILILGPWFWKWTDACYQANPQLELCRIQYEQLELACRANKCL